MAALQLPGAILEFSICTGNLLDRLSWHGGRSCTLCQVSHSLDDIWGFLTPKNPELCKLNLINIYLAIVSFYFYGNYLLLEAWLIYCSIGLLYITTTEGHV